MAKQPHNHRQAGFSFVELAIILSCVAILASAIMVGRSMILTSQLQSLMADAQKYQKALGLFKEKYKYYPGDMPTAESIWGSDTTGGGTCPNIASTTSFHSTTCNGNGDGNIGQTDTGSCNNYSQNYEVFRMWQQLADAGFIPGQFTGTQGSRGIRDSYPGVNIPSSSVPNVGYALASLNNQTPLASWFQLSFYHIFLIGEKYPADCYEGYHPFLSSQQAYLIDSKYDDGLPASGNLIAYPPVNSAFSKCSTSSNVLSSKYTMDTLKMDCSFIYRLQL